MKTTPALVAVPLLVLALSGCTLLGGSGPGGGGSGGSLDDPASEESAGGEELEAGSTACLMDREWNLDVAEAATQLGDAMTANGQSVVSSTGEGSQSIWFDQEGFAGSATSLTYTLVVNMEDGLVLTMAQHHEGAPGGEWAWEGEEDSMLTFTAWTGDYVVTTDMSINGTASSTSTVNTGGLAELAGTSMTVSCDGDTLTTQATGSPFAQHWTAGSDR